MSGNESIATGRQESARRGGLALSVTVYLALVAFSFLINYPGRLNPDSLDQLVQAVRPELLNDWHEPWTIYFWNSLSPILGQPSSALLVQSIFLFVYPSILIARTVSQNTFSALSWLGLGILIIALVELAGQISKDVLLLGFILSLFATISYSGTRSGRHWRLPVAFLLLIAATSIRPINAFLIWPPAALALSWQAGYRYRALPIALLVGALCAVQIPLVRLADAKVTHASHAKAESSLMIFDIAGISTNLHSDLFARMPNWPSRAVQHRPWECYRSYSWDVFRWGKCGEYFNAFNELGSDRYAYWLNAIVSHPGAYLLHRARYLFQCLTSAAPVAATGEPSTVNTAVGKDELFGPFTHGVDMRKQVLLWHLTKPALLFEFVAALAFSKVAGAFEIALSFATAFLAFRRKSSETEPVALLASGVAVANFLVVAAFGVSAEGRYLLPTYVCGILIFIGIVEKFRPYHLVKHLDPKQSSRGPTEVLEA